jgi:hypothetical protein
VAESEAFVKGRQRRRQRTADRCVKAFLKATDVFGELRQEAAPR